MSPLTDIRIRLAKVEDLEDCAICWGNRRDTYPSIYPLRLVNPNATKEERFARNVKDLKKMLNDPCNEINVACNLTPEGTESVVGYSIWARPEGFQRDVAQGSTALATEPAQDSDTKSTADDDLDPECNHELAAQLTEESKRVKKAVADGKRFWFLQQLFVHPDYQRRGVGTALIEHGLKMIENSENRETSDTEVLHTTKHLIGLTSSPQGQALYKRYGFEDVYWFNPKFDDVNEKGEWISRDVRWPLMVRR